jgi:hypothetical protein
MLDTFLFFSTLIQYLSRLVTHVRRVTVGSLTSDMIFVTLQQETQLMGLMV